ncbi:cobyrinate a,c-diamide synthase [Desulfosarcina sp.]|uniref:cobyrinate a,c-diamide synthase n=1 Tax=Desulfosarcina sp. TaxID=2027861 RepID=UPI0039706ADD
MKTPTALPRKDIVIKGIVIAGTHSGAGKTTVTLGLMAALAARGYTVAPFKVGPDFIDPGHHSRITGRTSRNLDGWMLSKAYNLETFVRNTAGADMAVVEGVMGLFDGFDGRSEAGSTAQMAKWLGLPVLLVVGARSMARSAAALVKGFEGFDDGLAFAGVLFNHLGSERHFTYLKEAMGGHVSMPVLGGLMRDAAIAFPERHLGLVTWEDHDLSPDSHARLAGLIENQLDLDRLIQRLPDIDFQAKPPGPATVGNRSGVRIGVARDAAFCFYYADNLELLQAAGARLVFFSPLADSRLPEGLDGLYFGGGYPELHAGALAENRLMRQEIRESSRMNMPVYGECGGFMYLCREMGDLDGNVFPMCGCLPFAIRMLDRLKALGYRKIIQTRATLLGPAGQSMRGHEFHYSTMIDGTADVSGAYRMTDRAGVEAATEGFWVGQTLGSYVHLHFGSCPQAATHFVNTCGRWRAEKKKNKGTTYETP